MKYLIIAVILLCSSTLNAKNSHTLGCINAYDAGYEVASWKAQGMKRLDAINKVKDIVSESNIQVTIEQINFLTQTVNTIYDSSEKNQHNLAMQTQLKCEEEM